MKLKHIQLIVLLFMLSSCGDWLNIQPKSEVTAENLYNNADGYRSALVGLYLGMSKESLYGSTMTLTQIEYMSHSIRSYYIPDPGAIPTLYQLANFITHIGDRNNLIENMFSKIWSTAYGVIANCNYFIDKLEVQDPGMFEPGIKELMLGEAYAIRAYIHYDMMRLFHYPYKSEQGKTLKCVPYVSEFGLELTGSSTSDQIMELALKDLQKAEELMEDTDPAITEKSYFDRYFIKNRQFKMNYLAVRALMARIYLQKEDYKKAYDNSTFVLDHTSRLNVRMATLADLELKDQNFSNLPYNRSFPMENIFAIYTENLGDYVNHLFSSTAPVASRVFLNRSFVTNYSTDVNDIRLNAWIDPPSGRRNYFLKNVRPTLQSEIDKYPLPCVPLIKLGEMYLIAAESAALDPQSGGVGESLRLFNEFREARGIDSYSNTNENELLEELYRQNYIEFIGEGQTFFFFKRINAAQIPFSLSIEIGQPLMKDISARDYTPDIPMGEVLGGRQKIN